MAENILEQPTIQPPAQQLTPEKAELDQLMQISLNGGIAPAPAVAQDQPITDTNTSAVVEQPQVTDIFAPFKEKFGYEKPEDALTEIEQLRAFKANPTVAEIKFENDYSEKVFKAIQAGKTKEVYTMLAEQDRLDKFTSTEITKDNAADIIKMGMQLKYKDLTPQEIDYKFSKQYHIPKEPVQGATELDEDFAERKQQWQELVQDVEMSKIIDAKLAKPELETAKAKLILPDIEQSVDEAYLQYKKELELQPQRDAEIREAYSKITPDKIETKIPFTDEANKIAFEFQFKPDDAAFKKAVDMTADINKLFGLFQKSDGTPDREGFLRFIHYGLNGEAMMLEAMKQAKNATIKATLPDNTQGGLVRQLPQTQEPDELAKNMAAAGITKNGYRQ